MTAKESDVSAAGKVLIIVENLPVPNDRRVWLEATTLRDAGYHVSVISIKGTNARKTHEVLDGIHVYRYPAPPQTSGFLSFVFEFAYCWIMSFVLSLVVWVREGIDVVHACNPPETFWLIGGFYKLFGKKFLFDHHDLSPEMYQSRFGKQGRLYKTLLLLERLTFKTADVVVTTNETHKQVAVERGNVPPEKVFIVRSGPNHHVLKPGPADPALKNGRSFLVAYLGVLNPQDGVDTLVRTADVIVNTMGRDDIQFVIMGAGDALDDLRAQAQDLGLGEAMTFTGWADMDTIRATLSTADVCVDTMPKTPYSDAATMNKILEYMSMARAIVAFNLVETQVSAQDAAIYAEPDNVQDLAEKILALLADPEQRAAMGARGRARIEQELAWEHQAPNLLAAYATVLGRA